MFGFLNVYKPKGKTSHDVVAILRKITKIKQIGHTGTLDPFAEGVLPVCIGNATRLIEYLADNKAYIATIQFGKSTSTYDLEGETVNISEKKVLPEEIESGLNKFRGEIEQLPPIYSAIKVNGKKLYEYARKGEVVEIKPRKAVIYELKLLNFDYENQILEIFISCSKGTYIRSIANDLGKELGAYGHLIKLIRTKAGMFDIENSVKLENLDSEDKVKANLLSPINYLNCNKAEINPVQKEKISHGNEINLNTENGTTVLIYNGNIAAIGEVNNNIFKCKKVFIR